MLTGELSDDQHRPKGHATVLLLSSDKDIMKWDDMVTQLEELDDQSQLLETPNLLLIPFDNTSGGNIQSVVSSQSYLYESLCELKDWIKLQRGNAKQDSHWRMSSLPHLS